MIQTALFLNRIKVQNHDNYEHFDMLYYPFDIQGKIMDHTLVGLYCIVGLYSIV